MADLSIFETLNGGDVALKGNDLFLANSLWNQPYLALFGGNTAQDTPSDPEDISEDLERFDHWGNSLLHANSPELQFNSKLERTLQEVALNSAGLQELQQVIEDDLSYLDGIADVEVTVSLDGVDRVRLDILLQEPENLPLNFVFLWDGTKLEEIFTLLSGVSVIQPPLLIGDEGQFLLGDEGQSLFGD